MKDDLAQFIQQADRKKQSLQRELSNLQQQECQIRADKQKDQQKFEQQHLQNQQKVELLGMQLDSKEQEIVRMKETLDTLNHTEMKNIQQHINIK